MSKPYTPDQLQNKFVVFSKILSVQVPKLETVNHATGPHAGMPYLYNSIDEAQADKYFDPMWDQVLPAEEYFKTYNKSENSL